MKELRINKKILDAMVSYMVVNTILNDDGNGLLYKTLGLPRDQKEAGK